MRSIISTAPDDIRAELRDLNVYRLLERARAYRPGTGLDVHTVTKRTLRVFARRATALEDEITDIDTCLTVLVAETAPELVARPGIGTDTASALLVAAGDNPDRLRNEATFAHLCGASPIDASSGTQQRHRLNRGGDRQANSALWKIVLTRMLSKIAFFICSLRCAHRSRSRATRSITSTTRWKREVPFSIASSSGVLMFPFSL